MHLKSRRGPQVIQQEQTGAESQTTSPQQHSTAQRVKWTVLERSVLEDHEGPDSATTAFHLRGGIDTFHCLEHSEFDPPPPPDRTMKAFERVQFTLVLLTCLEMPIQQVHR